jgi:hypothetical protein
VRRPAELDDADRRPFTFGEQLEADILWAINGNPYAEEPRGILYVEQPAPKSDTDVVNNWLARNWERPWQR